MKTLIISQAIAGGENPNLSNLVSAATKIDQPIDLLIIGKLDHPMNKFARVNNLFNWKIAHEDNLATFVAKSLAQFCQNYSHVLVAADSYGRDLLPKIAGILNLGQISEVIEIIKPNVFRRLMYAGNVLAELESLEPIKLVTIRPTSFAKYDNISYTDIADNQLSDLSLALLKTTKIMWQSEQISYNNTIDLAHAKLIVSGGFALGSKDNFDTLINGLAKALGGAVGASRAAVDAGYAANDSQIGQTGKIVAPQIYLSIGISGAAQHLAGIKNSQVIMAINIDQNAQIFEYADYGLVGDLFEIVPQLINKFIGEK